MPSEAFDNIVGLLRATELPEGLDELRAGYELLGSMVTPAEGASVEAATLGGAPGEWITPAEVDGDRTILYLHGGGYNIGSASSIAAGYACSGARRYSTVNSRAFAFVARWVVSPRCDAAEPML